MLEYHTGDIVVNEIEMIRTAFPGGILLLEGENDSRFFQKFIDENHCYIFISHGKENAVEAIDIAHSENIKGVLAIVDADFWRIDGYEPANENLMLSDGHDVECMIFNSTAFERVVKEYCSEAKIAAFDNLRMYIYERAVPIGVLRLASHRNSMDLVFRKTDYKKITQKNKIDIDIQALIRHVKSLTRRNAETKGEETVLPSDDEVFNIWSELLQVCQDYDRSELCCGHDLMGLFAIGLRRFFATLKEAIANKENLEKVFRLSFDTADFNKTVLAGLIRNWEQNNAPFRILK
ncbi:MAG: DUF4435 domain-containing protein [Desulfobacterales bacterium]|nr:DUF4435 domain-containing protein [Desulfobacterales bacterium]